MINWVDFSILLLAILFLLLAFFFLFLHGNRSDQKEIDTRYGVGKQTRRRIRQQAITQGLVLGLIGLVLVGIWRFLPQGQTTKEQPPVSSSPAPLPTTTNSQEKETPSADLPTALPPTATPITPTPPPPSPQVITPTPEPTSTPTEVPTVTPNPAGAYVSTIGGINLRSAPAGEIVQLIEDGTDLILLEGYETKEGYKWREVLLPDGLTGWVADEFITYRYPTP